MPARGTSMWIGSTPAAGRCRVTTFWDGFGGAAAGAGGGGGPGRWTGACPLPVTDSATLLTLVSASPPTMPPALPVPPPCPAPYPAATPPPTPPTAPPATPSVAT